MIQPKDLTDLSMVVGGTTVAAPVFIVDLYTDKLFSTIHCLGIAFDHTSRIEHKLNSAGQ